MFHLFLRFAAPFVQHGAVRPLDPPEVPRPCILQRIEVPYNRIVVHSAVASNRRASAGGPHDRNPRVHHSCTGPAG